MRWLDRIPLVWLVVLALWMAVAPITPEPHLIEKLRMLGEGTLSRPLDIFDLFIHAMPLLLLVLRLWRRMTAPRAGAREP
ncbi:MAG: hypothetical protein PSV40_22100 [Polaromonas sp.]|uniref:hypothetical protein n=1 Tax=Polaromonas sp. TaxID=1869339 RepID=UPI0024887396|nr:hypothetical protein [Polaromonas sp.]MDI1271789.1 hypothetical protein [Polaromonas sp.]